MSVLFTSAIDFTSASSLGISSKVMSQARAAAQAGHDVLISKDYGAETRIERPLSGEVVAKRAWRKGIRRREKYAFLGKWATENGIEVIVVRFDHLDGAFCDFSKRVKAKGIVVAVEFPTFPFDRERDARHKRLLDSRRYLSFLARRAYARLEEVRVRNAPKYIDYAITYLENDAIWGIPNITYDNGIDLPSIPMRSPKKPDGTIRLLAVAKFAPHHGLDRLIRGLAEYRGTRKVSLTLAGTGPELPYLEALVSESGLSETVKFAGVAVGGELDALFDGADVAVGSLGLHRIGISLGSTMKSREYCARGIPFIYSFPEKGFDGDEEFALMLPSGETPVDVESVVAFADKMSLEEGIPSRMREFAETRFDWKVQMDKVLTVLESAVGGRG